MALGSLRSNAEVHHDAVFDAWLGALTERYLTRFRVQEITRAVRALSSAYVERRSTARASALGTQGKRAAFALFYGPLHYLAVRQIVDRLDAAAPAPRVILDLGCGSGAAGSAWAVSGTGRSTVSGIDRHPWAIAEARWTYRACGLKGRATTGNLATRVLRCSSRDAVIAAYVLNELSDDDRRQLVDAMVCASEHGTRVLVMEPMAKRLTPWWDKTAERVLATGGREDAWRLPVDLPDPLSLLDRAAGLNHQVLTCRTLYMPRTLAVRRARFQHQ